jgi:hypothetical protein
MVSVSQSDEPIAGLRGFSVVLAQGDLKAGTGASENVPPAAAKALADLKDFLPYKSYRLLDTQWTMGSGRISGRLKGPEGKEYFIEVTTRKGATPDAPVSVTRFAVSEATPGADGTKFTRFRGSISSSQTQAQGEKAAPPSFYSILGLGAGNIINTSFSMNLGETVVVGTSRLQGDTALVVLLTAVSKTETAARK